MDDESSVHPDSCKAYTYEKLYEELNHVLRHNIRQVLRNDFCQSNTLNCCYAKPYFNFECKVGLFVLSDPRQNKMLFQFS